MDYSKLYDSPTSSPKAAPRRGVGQLQRTTRRTVKQVSVAQSLQSSLTDARLNYRAAEPSKFRTTLTQLGGTADAHYSNPHQFWQVREYVRDYDRNTPILGQLVDRALDQVLGCGLRVDPQTGDERADAIAAALWEAWSTDPEACDFSYRLTFDELERLAMRHTWIDGDVFAILDDPTGAVMLVEGDRVSSGGGTRTVRSASGEPVADLVHGVEVDAASRPIAYWFRKTRIGERSLRISMFGPVESSLMVRVTREGVVHIYDPKRVSQSRGVSAFVAVFDRISMIEDVEFAQLVQQQVAACIAAFITSEQNQQWGSRSTEEGADGSETVFDEFQPGMIARLQPGEGIDTFSPRNPTSDARQLAMQIVREIGLAIGMPLELSLLVTSDTTFHGYRGVIEAYKKTARRQQKAFGRRFRSRVYRWKVAQWVEAGLLPDLPTIARHVLRGDAWTYVDPLKDAQGDALRQSEGLDSPSQIAADRGRDYSQVVRETVRDRGALIEAAQQRAAELGITWQELLGRESPAPASAPVDEGEEEQADVA